MKNVINKLVPYILALVLLISIDLVFFAPQWTGKVLQQSDMISITGMSHEAKNFHEKTGQVTYWTNSMFGGMPTYQIYDPTTRTNLFDYFFWLFNLKVQGPLGYFFILSIASFIGLCCFGIGPWLSLIGAFSIAFASNHIGLVSAGHLTKIATLGFVPMIIAGTYLLFNKDWRSGFFVFTFGLAASIRMNHIQMTYYVGLIISIYVLVEMAKAIKEKKYTSLIKPGLAMLAGTVISFLVNYSLLTGLNSFSKDTMRGGSILSATSAQKSDINTASSNNGLGWDYAMQWSNGSVDLLSIIVPGAVGGSTNEKWSRNSDIAKSLRQGGVNIPKDFRLPLYWGDLPFTSGPDYVGILMVMLFLIGLFIVKGPFKLFALFSVIFLVLQSLGKNFSMLNHLLFDYLPYYNKFRTPNSILNVLTSVLPVFSIYSLFIFTKQSWSKEALNKLFSRTVLPLAGLLLLFVLLGPSLFEMKSGRSDSGWESNAGMYRALLDARASYFKSDTLRSLLLLITGGSLLYYMGLKKIKPYLFLIGFGALMLTDLFTVAKRYVDQNDFIAKKSDETNFKPREVDTEILKDQDLSYRVFDLSIDPFNSAIPSYYHKMIGGYSPAKLRRYQDMIDYYFSKVNISVLNMMNTKYIIDQKGVLQSNVGALGNAWFVSQIKTVDSPDEEIKNVGTINPAEEAVFLASEFKSIHLQPAYQKNGTIKLLNYSPNHLSYQSSTTSEQVAVFSEVWYGPDKGWTATIDGKPVDHFRVNYILRAMTVPPGDHKIEFDFHPSEFIANKNLSYFSGMLFGLMILAGIFWEIWRYLKRNPVMETEQVNATLLQPKKDGSLIKKNKKN